MAAFGVALLVASASALAVVDFRAAAPRIQKAVAPNRAVAEFRSSARASTPTCAVADLRRDPPVSRLASALPGALDALDDIRSACAGKRLMIFLDYDGTLSPIVKDPDAAFMPPSVRAAVDALSQKREVAIVSGRGRQKVRDFVQLDGLYYAGSHGFDIAGPNGLAHEVAADKLPILADAAAALRQKLAAIPGATVEDNKFSMSVHWRNVAPTDRPAVEAIVDSTLREAPFAGVLRKNSGKCVYELRPDVKWDKGEAVLYLLELLRRRETDFDEYGDDDGVAEERIAGFTEDEWYGGVLPVYVGDDVTDEDAFRAIAPFGAVSVLVCPSGDKVERPRATHATHTLRDVDDVRAFVDELASACAARPSVRGR